MAKRQSVTRAASQGGRPKSELQAIRKAVRSLHVFPGTGGKWLVHGIGVDGIRKRFSSKQAAVTYANDAAARRRLGVLIHTKRASLQPLPPTKTGLYRIVYERAQVLGYDDSVFINCPFDPEYSRLFPALVFAVADCGFSARCALEDSDSGESRIDKLYRIIGDCGHGIHDISRTQLNAEGLPRFNMPLELGVFLGARKYGLRRQRNKRCLILDSTRFRYQRFCSDLAGNDLRAHNDRPQDAVVVVRDWLRDARPTSAMPGGAMVFARYETFQKDLPLLCGSLHLDHSALPFTDLKAVISEWVRANPL